MLYLILSLPLGTFHIFSTWAVYWKMLRSLVRGSVTRAHLELRSSNVITARWLIWTPWWNWWGMPDFFFFLVFLFFVSRGSSKQILSLHVSNKECPSEVEAWLFSQHYWFLYTRWHFRNQHPRIKAIVFFLVLYSFYKLPLKSVMFCLQCKHYYWRVTSKLYGFF